MKQETIILMGIIKYLYLSSCSFYQYSKLRNEKIFEVRKILIEIFATIICVIEYLLLINKINGLYINIINMITQCIACKYFYNENNKSIITSILISNALTNIIFVISMFIETAVKRFFTFDWDYGIVDLLIIVVIGIVINIAMFKIRRINKGFQFLKEKINNEYLDIIMINISIGVIFIYSLFGTYYGDLTIHIMITFLIVSVIMIVMISKTIALAYKQKQLEKNLAEDDKIIKQKDAEIESLSKEKFEISKVSHEFEKRIKALELKATSNMNMEVSEENDLMKQINNLSKEYSTKLKQIKGSDKLKKTEVAEIDNMFEYLQNECEKSNIEFYLNINCDVNNMIDKVIAKNKLETLIGDLGTDAIHAVTMSKNNYKSIVTIIDKQEDIYLISMSDTGVEFKIDTLLKLGLEPATTHKEDGGSGIGYITTFETLNETKASLIIEEKNNESENEYTKTITIKFDGRNEYKIISYRADEIRKKQKDSRIIVENIKNSDNI